MLGEKIYRILGDLGKEKSGFLLKQVGNLGSVEYRSIGHEGRSNGRSIGFNRRSNGCIDRSGDRSAMWAIDRAIDRKMQRAVIFFYFSVSSQTYMDTWYVCWGIGGCVCRCMAFNLLCFSN